MAAPACAATRRPVGHDAALDYQHLVVHDADECSQSLSGWQQRYQQLGRGRFVGQLALARWNDCAWIGESTNRHMLQRMAAPCGDLVFGLAASVAPGSLFDRRPLTPSTLLVLEGGREHELLASGPVEMLGLHVGHGSLAAWGDEANGPWLKAAAARGAVELAPALAEALRRGLTQALRQAGAGTEPVMPPEQQMRRQLARIAQACRGAAADPAPPAPRPPSERARRTLALALAFMEAHLGDDIGIDDICRASHASASLLHESFKIHRRSSAHRVLLAMRLNQARRELRRNPGQSITALAHALRFSSSSHFTAQYRAMFGERPSELRRYR